MSKAPPSTPSPDAGQTAHQFFVVRELLRIPELARFYTDLLINSPTTVVAARDRQGFSKSTAYKYANTLAAELGIATELDTYENGSSLWRAEPVSGNWTDQTTIELGPVLIAVYGRRVSTTIWNSLSTDTARRPSLLWLCRQSSI